MRVMIRGERINSTILGRVIMGLTMRWLMRSEVREIPIKIISDKEPEC